jgi:hypothetical protein
MANVARCDWCNKESTYPVLNWYKVERWAYPDHTDKRAPTGPWHFCSMTCMGEYYSRVEKIDTTTKGGKKTYVEHLPSLVPPKPTPPPLRTLREGSIPEVKKYQITDKEVNPGFGKPWLCEHENENPNICNCPPLCYCRRDMCKGKSVPARYL